MNESKARAALQRLAEAAGELATVCDRDVTEFARTWHAIANNARVLERETALPQVRGDIESLLDSIASLFGYHPGAFTEAYIARSDFNEQVAENAKFDALKDRVSEAAGALRDALTESEVNTLAVRRHLTTLETVFLETHHQDEATRARELLNAPEVDCIAAARFASDLAQRKWTGAATARVPAIVGALKGELAPYIAEPSAAT